MTSISPRKRTIMDKANNVIIFRGKVFIGYTAKVKEGCLILQSENEVLFYPKGQWSSFDVHEFKKRVRAETQPTVFERHKSTLEQLSKEALEQFKAMAEEDQNWIMETWSESEESLAELEAKILLFEKLYR
jgi:ribosome-binding ATPase YchF (GTP1/OBG family)